MSPLIKGHAMLALHTHHALSKLTAAALLTALVLAPTGCSFDSAGLENIECLSSQEGTMDGGRVCQGGFWVGSTLEDMTPAQEDMGADVPRDMCIPKTPAELCTERDVECGPLTVLSDNCGNNRTLDCTNALMLCGGQGETCNASGECACVAETDEEFCMRTGAECGVVENVDNCETNRQVDCTAVLGGCLGDGSVCTQNMCSCTSESDLLFCGRNSAQCGEFTATDNCARARTVQCGTCDAGETCQADNTCPSCKPEVDEVFCARNFAQCGELTAADNCGAPRTVDCSVARAGGCTMGRVCGTGPNANTCVCPEPVCTDAQVCGLVTNACGEVVDCAQVRGGCADDEFCVANACVCDTPTCPAGANCGEVTNACGNSTSCGRSCAPDETCASPQLQCQCDPEDDQDFCARNMAACGVLSAVDNCGTPREGVDCGVCAGVGATCQPDNTCLCDPETDEQLCDTANAVCGTFSTVDQCGAARVVDCDTAKGGCDDAAERCALGSCVVCSPEDDVMFCTRNGATCGLRTASDNCGAPRSVDCSAAVGCADGAFCTAPTNTCTEPVISAANSSAGDAFGSSVAVGRHNATGKTLLFVGAPGDAEANAIGPPSLNAGAVYVFERDSTTNAWTQIQKLVSQNREEGNQFGTALDFDGDQLVVSSQFDDLNAFANSRRDTGTLEVFSYNSASASWRVQGRKLFPPGSEVDEAMGASVAIDGNLIVAGSTGFDGGGTDRGSIVIYTRNTTSNLWDVGVRVTHPNAADGDRFGVSVDVEGARVLGGADFDGDGKAFLFEQNTTGTWAAVGAFEQGVDSFHGRSVRLQGGVVFTGAPGFEACDPTCPSSSADNYGALFAYLPAGTWDRSASYRPPMNPNDEALGHRLAIDATILAATTASPTEFGRNTPASVYIGTYDLSVNGSYTPVVLTRGINADDFGASLDLGDGVVAVGAPGTSSGTGVVYLFSP
ncbi:MAG: hypothetical protein AAGI01_02555 [Myxococcota bacterium]